MHPDSGWRSVATMANQCSYSPKYHDRQVPRNSLLEVHCYNWQLLIVPPLHQWTNMPKC